MNFKPDFSDIDKADFDKYVAENDYCKEKNKQLETFQFVGEML